MVSKYGRQWEVFAEQAPSPSTRPPQKSPFFLFLRRSSPIIMPYKKPPTVQVGFQAHQLLFFTLPFLEELPQ